MREVWQRRFGVGRAAGEAASAACRVWAWRRLLGCCGSDWGQAVPKTVRARVDRCWAQKAVGFGLLHLLRC